MKLKFAPMPGARLNATDAAVVGRELLRLNGRFNCIRPVDIVEAARPAKSPLHPFFDWDDTEAARLWREEQARTLVRQVRVVYLDDDKKDAPAVRAFVNVSAVEGEERFEGNAYRPVSVVRGEPEYREQVLARAKDELRGWQNRYADLREYFEGVFSAIEEVK